MYYYALKKYAFISVLTDLTEPKGAWPIVSTRLVPNYLQCAVIRSMCATFHQNSFRSARLKRLKQID